LNWILYWYWWEKI